MAANYTFLTEDDFDVQVQEEILGLLGEGITIERAERMAIDQIKAHISGRYDTDFIFGTTRELRDHYVIMIVIDILLFHLWSKKAPRMVPEYRNQRYSDVLDWLKDVGTGKTPTSLPPRKVDDFQNELKIFSRYAPNDNKY